MSPTAATSPPTTPATAPASGSRGAAAAATRAAIAEAGARLFAARGYGPTSVRAVAAEAGVDPALVIRHFGSKEGLFLATVPMEGHFEHVTAGPLPGLGRRLVASLFGEDRELRYRVYRAMMRASDSEPIRARLLRGQERMFIEPLAPRLPGPLPELRARLVAAQFSGLLDALAMLDDERVAAADVDAVVTLYGDAIQGLIDGPAAIAAAERLDGRN